MSDRAFEGCCYVSQDFVHHAIQEGRPRFQMFREGLGTCKEWPPYMAASSEWTVFFDADRLARRGMAPCRHPFGKHLHVCSACRDHKAHLQCTKLFLSRGAWMLPGHTGRSPRLIQDFTEMDRAYKFVAKSCPTHALCHTCLGQWIVAEYKRELFMRSLFVRSSKTTNDGMDTDPPSITATDTEMDDDTITVSLNDTIRTVELATETEDSTVVESTRAASPTDSDTFEFSESTPPKSALFPFTPRAKPQKKPPLLSLKRKLLDADDSPITKSLATCVGNGIRQTVHSEQQTAATQSQLPREHPQINTIDCVSNPRHHETTTDASLSLKQWWISLPVPGRFCLHGCTAEQLADDESHFRGCVTERISTHRLKVTEAQSVFTVCISNASFETTKCCSINRIVVDAFCAVGGFPVNWLKLGSQNRFQTPYEIEFTNPLTVNYGLATPLVRRDARGFAPATTIQVRAQRCHSSSLTSPNVLPIEATVATDTRGNDMTFLVVGPLVVGSHFESYRALRQGQAILAIDGREIVPENSKLVTPSARLSKADSLEAELSGMLKLRGEVLLTVTANSPPFQETRKFALSSPTKKLSRQIPSKPTAPVKRTSRLTKETLPHVLREHFVFDDKGHAWCRTCQKMARLSARSPRTKSFVTVQPDTPDPVARARDHANSNFHVQAIKALGLSFRKVSAEDSDSALAQVVKSNMRLLLAEIQSGRPLHNFARIVAASADASSCRGTSWPDDGASYTSPEFVDQAVQSMAEAAYVRMLTLVKDSNRYVAYGNDESSDSRGFSFLVHSYAVARSPARSIRPIRGQVPQSRLKKLPILQSSYAGIEQVKSAKAAGLMLSTKHRLEADGITAASVACVCLDGASVNQGQHSGLIKRFQTELNDKTIGYHCAAHRGNLSLQDAAKEIPTLHYHRLRKFLCFVPRYISASGKRQRQLHQTVALTNLDRAEEARKGSVSEEMTESAVFFALIGRRTEATGIRTAGATRWVTLAHAAEDTYNLLPDVIRTLEQLGNDDTSVEVPELKSLAEALKIETQDATAVGMRKMIDRRDSALWLCHLVDFYPVALRLNQSLQTDSFDFTDVQRAVKKAKDELRLMQRSPGPRYVNREKYIKSVEAQLKRPLARGSTRGTKVLADDAVESARKEHIAAYISALDKRFKDTPALTALQHLFSWEVQSTAAAKFDADHSTEILLEKLQPHINVLCEHFGSHGLTKPVIDVGKFRLEVPVLFKFWMRQMVDFNDSTIAELNAYAKEVADLEETRRRNTPNVDDVRVPANFTKVPMSLCLELFFLSGECIEASDARQDYPNVAELAYVTRAIIGHNAGPERTFSVFRRLLTRLRMSMTTARLDQHLHIILNGPALWDSEDTKVFLAQSYARFVALRKKNNTARFRVNCGNDVLNARPDKYTGHAFGQSGISFNDIEALTKLQVAQRRADEIKRQTFSEIDIENSAAVARTDIDRTERRPVGIVECTGCPYFKLKLAKTFSTQAGDRIAYFWDDNGFGKPEWCSAVVKWVSPRSSEGTFTVHALYGSKEIYPHSLSLTKYGPTQNWVYLLCESPSNTAAVPDTTTSPQGDTAHRPEPPLNGRSGPSDVKGGAVASAVCRPEGEERPTSTGALAEGQKSRFASKWLNRLNREGLGLSSKTDKRHHSVTISADCTDIQSACLSLPDTTHSMSCQFGMDIDPDSLHETLHLNIVLSLRDKVFVLDNVKGLTWNFHTVKNIGRAVCNVGSTCYFSAIVQCISSISHVHDLIKGLNIVICQKFRYVSLLRSSILLLGGGGAIPNVLVSEFLRALGQRQGKTAVYCSSIEHDACEFFIELVTVLEEDIGQIFSVFRYVLTQNRCCVTCQTASTIQTAESVRCIPLSDDTECEPELTALIAKSETEEIVEYNCEACSCAESTTRSFCSEAAGCVVINMKRFDNYGRRIGKTVDFPLKMQMAGGLYTLQAVVYHHETVNEADRPVARHYTAAVLQHWEGSRTWCLHDDARSPVPVQTPPVNDAYALFYVESTEGEDQDEFSDEGDNAGERIVASTVRMTSADSPFQARITPRQCVCAWPNCAMGDLSPTLCSAVQCGNFVHHVCFVACCVALAERVGSQERFCPDWVQQM